MTLESVSYSKLFLFNDHLGINICRHLHLALLTLVFSYTGVNVKALVARICITDACQNVQGQITVDYSNEREYLNHHKKMRERKKVRVLEYELLVSRNTEE